MNPPDDWSTYFQNFRWAIVAVSNPRMASENHRSSYYLGKWCGTSLNMRRRRSTASDWLVLAWFIDKLDKIKASRSLKDQVDEYALRSCSFKLAEYMKITELGKVII